MYVITTANITENTNLYYTDARARASISVTDAGGDGSLAYRSNVAASAAAARIAMSCTWMGPAREQLELGGGAREFGQW